MLLLPLAPLLAVAAAGAVHAQTVPADGQPPVETEAPSDGGTPTDQPAPTDAGTTDAQ
ncbi:MULTISPECIES: hypothetical protein [Novosphingobium]|uniref:hypothetical protein n=1 Tax=Novosphingobium TaxID=165696 RepID=UPI001374C40C|nr:MULTISPECIES: hypothetical protein [Novosphingobium]